MFSLAVLREARGGACGSSNQRAGAHRRAQPERCVGVCQDCDRVTASLDSCLLLYRVVSLIV